jgi:hypothetical protein
VPIAVVKCDYTCRHAGRQDEVVSQFARAPCPWFCRGTLTLAPAEPVSGPTDRGLGGKGVGGKGTDTFSAKLAALLLQKGWCVAALRKRCQSPRVA